MQPQWLKKNILDALNEKKIGWWDTALTFKRVITMPETGKCKYVDTRIRVRQKAESAMDAYNHLIDHLINRPEVDTRSQFPSCKSEKYEYAYLGEDSVEEKPAEEAV